MISLKTFTGEFPRTIPTLLPDNAAQAATDCDFTEGALVGVRTRLLYSSAFRAGIKAMFVYGANNYTWTRDVDAVRGPMVNDAYGRFYWTDGSTYNVSVDQSGGGGGTGGDPSTTFKVGVPTPVTPASLNTALNKFSMAVPGAVVGVVSAGIKGSDGSYTQVATGLDASLLPTGAGVTESTPLVLSKSWTIVDASYPTANTTTAVTSSTDGSGNVTAAGGNTVTNKIVLRVAFNDAAGTTLFTAEFATDGQHILPSSMAMFTATLAHTTNTLTLSIAANTNYLQNRAYIYTYVNAWGEESGPSPAISMDAIDGQRIDFIVPCSVATGYKPITAIRTYRTATGSLGTNYLYIGQLTVPAFTATTNTSTSLTSVSVTAGTPYIGMGISGAGIQAGTTITNIVGATYTISLAATASAAGVAMTTTTMPTNDTVLTADLGAAISTMNYDCPPQALSGLCTMHNGILAAFNGNELYFMQPYLPYAYVPSTIKPLPYPIVGICATEGGLYVTTTGIPYLITGNTPDAMTDTPVQSLYAGVSKWAICKLGERVAYATHDGLMMLQGISASLETSFEFFTRNVWRDRYAANLANMHLHVHDGNLIAWFDNGTPGFMIRFEESNLSFTKLADVIDAAWRYPVGDGLYVFYSGTIYTFNGGATTKAFSWQSKDFVLERDNNFGFLKLVGTGVVTIQLYADGTLAPVDIVAGSPVTTKTVTLTGTDADVFRLPSGTLSRRFSLSLAGAAGVTIKSAFLFNSMSELNNV